MEINKRLIGSQGLTLVEVSFASILIGVLIIGIAISYR